uniref:F-box domain-containing protein n=1 Tax=Caenorhabditis tropicalis TaxID=1561998 RepID=A0A1I7U1U9_9PELO
MQVSVGFPFLRLPVNATECILECMDNSSILIFSITSTRATQLVANHNRQSEAIRINFGNDIKLHVKTRGVFNLLVVFQPTRTNPLALNTYVQVDETVHSWVNTYFQLKNYITHAMIVFNQKSIEVEVLRGYLFPKDLVEDQFRSLLELFGHAHEIWIQNSKLAIGTSLVSNYDCVKLGSMVFLFQNLQLNDLLSLNSKRIEITQSFKTPRYLNRFIKLWMNGINRRLKYLLVISNNQFALSENSVLKGVQKVEVGYEERNRIWMISNKFDSPEFQLTGAYKISANDGRQATVVFKLTYGLSIVELIVGDFLTDNNFRLR